MRFPEQRLWDAMRGQCPPGFWLQRIENVVVEGMPDVFVVSNGRACWVELKVADRPKRPGTPLLGNDGLRLSQINWHLKAATYGLPTYVLIRDDIGWLYLVPGRHADMLNSWPMSRLDNSSIARTWLGIFTALGLR